MLVSQTHELETVNLSGLPLAGLNINAREGDYVIDFTTPNPTGHGDCHISLDGGDFRGTGLLNSRFDSMLVRTFSGCICLSFDGLGLEHDMNVRLESESGDVRLEIPKDIPAYIVYRTGSGTLSKVDVQYNQIDSTTYETGGYHLSESPRLSIEIDTVMGDLHLSGK